MYESGKLELGLGVEGVEDQLISNCFPPEGAWAEPADFARIRTLREREARNRARHRRLVFAGIQTRVGDKLVRLRSSSRLDGPYHSVRAPDEDTPANSKIAMFVSHDAFAAVFENPDDDVAEIAKRLGEPPPFIERIRQVHTTARSGVWMARSSTVLAAALRVAGTNGGLVTGADLVPRFAASWDSANANARAADPANWTLVGRDTMRLRPCECGSLLRCAMRIREPIGLVCLECHRDDGGLLWPAVPYDRWRLTEDARTARRAHAARSPAVSSAWRSSGRVSAPAPTSTGGRPQREEPRSAGGRE